MTTQSYPTRRKQLHIAYKILRAIPFAIAFVICGLFCIFAAVCGIMACVVVMVACALLMMVVAVPLAAVVVAMLISGFLVPRLGTTYRGWASRFGNRIDAGVDRLEKVLDRAFDGVDRAFDGFDWIADKTLDRIC